MASSSKAARLEAQMELLRATVAAAAATVADMGPGDWGGPSADARAAAGELRRLVAGVESGARSAAPRSATSKVFRPSRPRRCRPRARRTPVEFATPADGAAGAAEPRLQRRGGSSDGEGHHRHHRHHRDDVSVSVSDGSPPRPHKQSVFAASKLSDVAFERRSSETDGTSTSTIHGLLKGLRVGSVDVAPRRRSGERAPSSPSAAGALKEGQAEIESKFIVFASRCREAYASVEAENDHVLPSDLMPAMKRMNRRVSWAIFDEMMRAKDVPPDRLLSREEFAFDFAIMVLLVVVFVSLPLTLAFEEVNRSMTLVNFLFDCVFMVDVLKNFNVGYTTDDGVLVFDRHMIASNYRRGWFLVDVISSVPVDQLLALLLGNSGGGGDVYQAKKAFKVLRLVRMTKLLKLLPATPLVQRLRAKWIDVLDYYKVHYPKESWVVAAGLMRKDGKPLMSVSNRYMWCLHKAFVLLAGEAYGYPLTSMTCESLRSFCRIESWFTILCLYIGTLFYAGLVSNMSAIIVNANLSRRSYQDQLNATNEYMRSKRLPPVLRDRVRGYFQLRFSEGRMFNEKNILNNLNPELRKEISTHNTRGLLEKVPLLSNSPPRFFHSVALALEPHLFFTGDTCVGNTVVRVIADGSFFGEGAVLSGGSRSATIRVKETSSTYAIPGPALVKILEDLPVVGDYLRAISERRLDYLRSLDPSVDAESEYMIDEEDAQTPLYRTFLDQEEELLDDEDINHNYRLVHLDHGHLVENGENGDHVESHKKGHYRFSLSNILQRNFFSSGKRVAGVPPRVPGQGKARAAAPPEKRPCATRRGSGPPTARASSSTGPGPRARAPTEMRPMTGGRRPSLQPGSRRRRSKRRLSVSRGG
ncbi:voltage-gated potassium channel [Aureococcus anophagefferens]|nr:voltage-gated potassium channel [Aureococcus anophagefferens]